MSEIRRSVPLQGALAFLLFILLFLGGPHYLDSPVFEEIWNLGHIVAFALWTYLLLRFTPLGDWPWGRQVVAVLAGAVAVGCLTEWLQVWALRTPDLADVSRDLLGSALVLAFWSKPHRLEPSGWGTALRFSAIIGLAAALLPLWGALQDELQMRRDFPVLASFESAREIRRWQGRAAVAITGKRAFHGERALQIRMDTADSKYSGSYVKDFRSDWRGFRSFRFAAFNPGPERVAFHLRINDREHQRRKQRYSDRYNAVFTLQPGWNDISISVEDLRNAPGGRTMDLAQIETLAFFIVRPHPPATVYLDYLRLE